MSESSTTALLDPVLTAAAMREADRFTIEDFGIPGFTLMETAGRRAASSIARRYGPLSQKGVTCFCGKGNNGGDGFVVARVLSEAGAEVRVVTLYKESDLSGDAGRNYELLRQLAGQRENLQLVHLDDLSRLEDEPKAHI